jgi:uncharacterized integral membrane protein (TIGR00698 family)
MIPWFAVLFIGVSVFNSFHLLPPTWVDTILRVDTVLLAAAMAALGLRTHVSAIRQAGVKPLLLAGCLFVFLVCVGALVNGVVAQLVPAGS